MSIARCIGAQHSQQTSFQLSIRTWLGRLEIQEIYHNELVTSSWNSRNLLFLLCCLAQFSSPASTRSTRNSQQPSLFSFQFEAHDSHQPSFQLAPRSATQPGSKYSAFDSNREIRQQPTTELSAFCSGR